MHGLEEQFPASNFLENLGVSTPKLTQDVYIFVSKHHLAISAEQKK